MLSLRGIAWMNLRGHPARTAALIVFTALMTLVVFGGALVVQGVRQSLETVRARLGADILVVPDDAGSEFDAQTALIQAEPGYFYMGADVLGRVAATPGVERASAQLFLASTRESCCSARLQIIAFDPATDFTVQPWIEDALGEGAIGEGDIVIGSNVTAGGSGTIRLFGNDLRVVGQFAPTGSTLDDAVYMNFDTFGAVVKSSVDKGLNKYGPAASGDVISSVSVEVRPGHDVDAVAADIESRVDGVTAVTSKTMVSGIADGLAAISRTVAVLIAIVWATGLTMTVLVFTLTIRERRGEFAALTAVGASRGVIARIVVGEAMTADLIGGAAGIAVSGVLLGSFRTLVGQVLGVGFVLPPAGAVAALAAASLACAGAAAALSSWIAVRSINRMDPSLVLREGE